MGLPVAITVTTYAPADVEDTVFRVRVEETDPPAGSTGVDGLKDAVGGLATLG